MHRVWMLVALASCGRVGFDSLCDEPNTLRCVDGVQQTCVDRDGKPEWTWDIPCTSGVCDTDLDRCSYSGTCGTAALVTPLMASTACMGGTAPYPWQLVEPPGNAPIVIDGRAVSSCMLADFGKLCTPRRLRIEGTANETMCGDDCTGACTSCEPGGAPGSQILGYVSPTMDLERFDLVQIAFVQQAPGESSGTVGFPPFETRYVLMCRPACGPDGLNAALSVPELLND